jgi:mutator protein MutT
MLVLAFLHNQRAEGLFSVAALVFREGKVLAVSRKNNHSDFGLAGGKIDPGETPEEAIIRELREETGISARRLRKVYEDLDRVENGESRPCRTYLVEEWSGEIISKENAVIKWILPDELFLPSNSFCKYNIALFDYLEKNGESKLWKI